MPPPTADLFRGSCAIAAPPPGHCQFLRRLVIPSVLFFGVRAPVSGCASSDSGGCTANGADPVYGLVCLSRTTHFFFFLSLLLKLSLKFLQAQVEQAQKRNCLMCYRISDFSVTRLHLGEVISCCNHVLRALASALCEVVNPNESGNSQKPAESL